MTLDPQSPPKPDYFAISYRITALLAESSDANIAVHAILQYLCQSLDWQASAFWIVDDRKMRLLCTGFWSSSSFPQGSTFEQVTRVREFAMAEGLPGRVWNENRTIWLAELDPDSFPRLMFAKDIGMQSAVAFPISSSTGSMGVIELLSYERREVDEEKCNFLGQIGFQMGVFLERARVKADLQELDSQFMMLAENASDVIFTIDLDSYIIFTNSAVERVFGYKPAELIGKKLTSLMPERMRARHEAGLGRYAQTGEKRIHWPGVKLPGLHRDGHEIPLEIGFDEFRRQGQRIITGFARMVPAEKAEPGT